MVDLWDRPCDKGGAPRANHFSASCGDGRVARILLVDDDPAFATDLQAALREQSHDARWLDRAEEALGLLASPETFDLVLLDNKMPRMSGLDFLAAAPQPLRAPVILMTGAHNDRTAIQATRLGAFGYVIKPLDPGDDLGQLGRMIGDALEITRRPGVVQLQSAEEGGEDTDDSILVGRSEAMLKVLSRIGLLAKVDETVLILGETGTGKDLVARAIHTNSARKDGPFVAMNCSAFNDNLLDDELFGHEPGAFTGADRLRKGRFEHAGGGTLFLDELGDMPLTLQAKLLRVLENREVVRLGSNDPTRVDVRVLAATHRDLAALVRENKFRQDLYFRLEGLTITLPPLRERAEDIERLARHFLRRMFGASSAPRLHPSALERLRGHHWPGNIRQFQKVLCRAAGACRGPQIMSEDLDFGELGAGAAAAPRPAADEEDQQTALRRLITAVWEKHPTAVWHVLQDQLEREVLLFARARPGLSEVKLAECLGVSRNYLRKLIKKHGL
jgi:DNA-binding NtrC family response regulator